MLITLSPAKALNMDPVEATATQPRFADDTAALITTARTQNVGDLMKLMSISENLAKLNHQRFADFAADPAPGTTKPAAFAFAGDTYQGLEFATMEPDAQRWAQDHLRILSGLYGVLRPHDAIQPYRLEMGSRLATGRGKSLYEFWGDRIADALRADAADLGSDLLINCASQEYFRAANRPALSLRVITPRFFEDKNGTPKMVSFYAKQARGMMARFICEHRISDPDHLRDFDMAGYRWMAELSEPDNPAFLRA